MRRTPEMKEHEKRLEAEKKVKKPPTKSELLARKSKVKRYIKFAEKIIRERGRVYERREESCYTKVKSWLSGFAHFSFHGSYGESSMGGSTVKIFYHPNDDIIDKPASNPVMIVRWHSAEFNIESCHVEVFSDSPEWQTAINIAIKQKKEVIAEIEQAIEDKKDKAAAKERRKKEESLFTAEAERLGF